MAKEKKTSKKMNKSKNSVQTRKEVLNSTMYNDDIKKVIKCIVGVIIVFLVMYLLTLLILKDASTDYITQDDETTAIQYTEILAGTSFSKKENEYLVLFYNVEEDENSVYGDLISDYQSKEDKIPIYYVDLSNAMNKSVVSDESNDSASSVEELKIKEPTLIKFSANSISEYIEGEEAISNYLNN